jgi:hypothetical protein
VKTPRKDPNVHDLPKRKGNLAEARSSSSTVVSSPPDTFRSTATATPYSGRTCMITNPDEHPTRRPRRP